MSKLQSGDYVVVDTGSEKLYGILRGLRWGDGIPESQDPYDTYVTVDIKQIEYGNVTKGYQSFQLRHVTPSEK